jgi:hypothetical protein
MLRKKSELLLIIIKNSALLKNSQKLENGFVSYENPWK